MKKLVVVFSFLIAISTSAFALNAEDVSAKDVQKKVAAAQKVVQKYDSFKYTGAAFLEIVGAYEEVYLVDAEEATSLNQLLKQAVFTTAEGEKALITSCVVKSAISYAMESGSSYAYTELLGDFAEENVVDNFYSHLEKPYCPGKNRFEVFALDMLQQKQYGVLSQHIYQNLVVPFAKLGDEEAIALAKCYVTYEVGDRTLLDYARRGRGGIPNSIGEEMEMFADRVEALAK